MDIKKFTEVTVTYIWFDVIDITPNKTDECELFIEECKVLPFSVQNFMFYSEDEYSVFLFGLFWERLYSFPKIMIVDILDRTNEHRFYFNKTLKKLQEISIKEKLKSYKE